MAQSSAVETDTPFRYHWSVVAMEDMAVTQKMHSMAKTSMSREDFLICRRLLRLFRGTKLVVENEADLESHLYDCCFGELLLGDDDLGRVSRLLAAPGSAEQPVGNTHKHRCILS